MIRSPRNFHGREVGSLKLRSWFGWRESSALASAFVFTLGGCGNASSTLGPRLPPIDVVGCYSVSTSQWTGPRESPDLPSSIVLLDSVGTAVLERGEFLARPFPLGSASAFTVAYWRRPEDQLLYIVFSNDGYVGIRASLVWGWGDNSWRGTAHAYTDTPPFVEARATVRLQPRAC